MADQWLSYINSDKFCTQGGILKAGVTKTFSKPFKNTSYTIAIGICSASGDIHATEPKIKTKTTTQFAFNQAFNGSTTYNSANYEWMCSGYIA